MRRHSGITISPVVGKVNSIRIPANENLEPDVPVTMPITTLSAAGRSGSASCGVAPAI